MATHSSAEAIPLGQNRPAPGNAARMPLAERLSTLIDQIAGLAEEAGAAAPSGFPTTHGQQAAPPASLADLARRFYSQRRRRSRHLPAGLFGEPAWDILLDLAYAARANELRSIKSACLSSHAPEATALRHIDRLLHFGLVERIDDKTDRRRKFLRLTGLGERKMEEFLASMPPLGDHGEDLIRYIGQLG